LGSDNWDTYKYKEKGGEQTHAAASAHHLVLLRLFRRHQACRAM
jgi:hypothetical protein